MYNYNISRSKYILMEQQPPQPPPQPNKRKKIIVHTVNEALEILKKYRDEATEQDVIDMYNKYIKEIEDEIKK
jgi:hypothetical protein